MKGYTRKDGWKRISQRRWEKQYGEEHCRVESYRNERDELYYRGFRDNQEVYGSRSPSLNWTLRKTLIGTTQRAS